MNFFRSLFEIGHGGHRQIRSMEGVRGLAVFMVFMVHYTTLVEPWLGAGIPTREWATSLRGMGNAGVDLFFVLSGYLIYGTLISKPRPLAAYFRRRIQRIYPAFLAVFAIYLALSWLFPRESKIPTDGLLAAGSYILGNLLLLPGLFPIEPMIAVAWSLSYEMFYYLVIPVVIALLRLRGWPRGARMAAFLGVAILGIAYAFQFGGGHVRLVMFVAGILLFETLESRMFPRVDALGLVALVIGMGLIEHAVFGPGRFVVLFICLGLVH